MAAPYFAVPFATGGDQLPDGIPVGLQPDGSISYTLGWGPDYELDDTQPGYKPVGRREMNSAFNAVTWAIGEIQFNGFPIYRAGAAPYPINAVVRHLDKNWRSTVINNSTVPGDEGANWVDTALVVEQATTTTAGIMRLATPTQVRTGTNPDSALTPATARAIDPWALWPIGVPIPVLYEAGAEPAINNPNYRYIKLTAGDAYNAGVIISEVTTGVLPLLTATGVISLAGSVLNGKTVNLINSEKRTLRGSTLSAGVELLDDSMQGHVFNSGWYAADNGATNRPDYTPGIAGSPAAGRVNEQSNGGYTRYQQRTGPMLVDGANGTPRVSNETRAKSVGVTYYLRIK